MAACDAAHSELDKLVGKKVQIGTLPPWTRVRGKVAWKVVRGPYSELPGSWMAFMHEVGSGSARPSGPTGDVYACQPEDHAQDGGSKLLTILYAPVA
jgi:hypothetical protein